MMFRTPVTLIGISALLAVGPINSAKAGWAMCSGTAAMGYLGSLMSPYLMPGDACTIGDKVITYKGGSLVGVSGMGVVSLGNITPETHTLAVVDASGFSGSTFNYSVQAIGSELIKSFKTANTSSGVTPNYTLAAVLNTSLWSAVIGPGGSDMTTITPPLNLLNVEHTYTQLSPGMVAFVDTVTQTPGPLPILGAGTAFGFARRLRKRVKSTF